MRLKHVKSFSSAQWVAIAAALLLPISGAWQLTRARGTALIDAEQSTRTLSVSLAQHAERTVEAVDLTLADTVERVQQGEQGELLRSHLSSRAQDMKQARSIDVIGADGQLIIDAAGVISQPNISDRDYFRWHQTNSSHEVNIGDIIVSRVSGRQVIPISRRLNKPDGSFDGIVLSALLPEFFEGFYSTLNGNKGASFALWGAPGSLLVRYPSAPDKVGRASLDADSMRELAATGGRVFRTVSDLDGVDRIIALKRLDKYPLVVSASVSVADALAAWRHEALLESVVLVGVSAALLILVGLVERHRKQVEKIIGENSRQLKATLDLLNQGIIKVSADGIIELCNQRFIDLFGLSVTDITQSKTSLSDFKKILEERGEFTKVINGSASSKLAECIPFVHEAYELRRDDGWVVEVQTVPLADGGIIRSYTDIADRRAAEKLISESEARYRMLADATSDMISQLDLGFRRRYVSPASRSVLGYEPAELIGTRPSDMIHPEEAETVRRTAQQLVAGVIPEGRATMTYRTKHKSGEWVWVEANVAVVNDASGNPELLISSLRDVEGRQRAARHLERAKTTAENAARQKSEFVANMSHELRTPLTGILGLHDLLQADPTLGPKQRRYLIMARDAGRSLLTVVNDVLDFSKIEAGELTIEQEPFSLLPMVEACEDLLVEAVRAKSLRLDVDVVALPYALRGDAARLRQILLNLLTNAVKFTSEGSVTLSARYDAATERLRFEVTDTGVGIPQDKLSRIFLRFSQADSSVTRRFGGTGLGLAICKRLAELMNGEIGVTSVVGQGSTFWFEVPSAKVSDTGDGVQVASVGATIARHILLAEDNLVNQEIIKAMLESRSHVVTIVDNGAAAAAAAASGSKIDIILMDLQMPIMDGLTATRAIRSAEVGSVPNRAVPIIGLTANAMVEDVDRCRAAGMNGHVAKPVDWAELLGIIDQVTLDEFV